MPDPDPAVALWGAVVLTMAGLVVAALWPVPLRRAALALAVLVLPLIAGLVGLLAASVHRWETARDVDRERLSREASPGTEAGAEAGARGTDES